jgi:hypothetical protein
MTTEALKSTPITNLDASPIVRLTSGEGGGGYLRHIGAYVTPSGSMAALSTYRLVRVPSTVKVKRIQFQSEAQGAGKFQIGVYPSDSTTDGTNAAAPNTATSVALFAGDIDCTSAVLPGDYTFYTGGSYTLDKRAQPLWQAAGLSADPGGNLDIVLTVHTTDITTGGGKVGIGVDYEE